MASDGVTNHPLVEIFVKQALRDEQIIADIKAATDANNKDKVFELACLLVRNNE